MRRPFFKNMGNRVGHKIVFKRTSGLAAAALVVRPRHQLRLCSELGYGGIRDPPRSRVSVGVRTCRSSVDRPYGSSSHVPESVMCMWTLSAGGM